ncbi:hypothetical protein GW17_00031391 [Ensete ventricosum]|nr:hypothetical protein GW17_00031391 [Ensete ventricosum]
MSLAVLTAVDLALQTNQKQPPHLLSLPLDVLGVKPPPRRLQLLGSNNVDQKGDAPSHALPSLRRKIDVPIAERIER